MALLVKSHIPNWSHTSSSGSFPHSRNTGLSSVSQTQHVYSWTPNLHPCYWFCPESFSPPLYSTLLFLPVFPPFWFLPFSSSSFHPPHHTQSVIHSYSTFRFQFPQASLPSSTPRTSQIPLLHPLRTTFSSFLAFKSFFNYVFSLWDNLVYF